MALALVCLSLLFCCVFAFSACKSLEPFALKLKIVADPDDRRRHLGSKTLLGGVGIFLAVVISSFITFQWVEPPQWLSLFFVCSFGVLLIGVIDDRYAIGAAPKFIGQFLAAGAFLAFSPEPIPLFSQIDLPVELLTLIAFFWIIGITNALNIIDGLDGLCSGITAIGFFSLALITAFSDSLFGGTHPFLTIVSLLYVAGILGFLFHNYYPSRMFLGDNGSLFLGFSLSVLMLQIQPTTSAFSPLLIPPLLILVPIVDVTLAVLRRLKMRRPVFQADRGHIHHRIQRTGLSHKQAVHALWAVSLFCAGAGVLASTSSSSIMTFVVYAFCGIQLLSLLFFQRHLENRLARQASSLSENTLKQEFRILGNHIRLKEQMEKLILDSSKKFSLITFRYDDYISEVMENDPNQIISFYRDFLGFLKTEFRANDFAAKLDANTFAVFLEEFPNDLNTQNKVLSQRKNKIREIQERHHIFQGDKKNPEGFHVYNYPQDRGKIFSLLKSAAPVSPSIKRIYPEKNILAS